LLAASLTTASAFAQALYIYFKNRNNQAEAEVSTSNAMVDDTFNEPKVITRIEAV